MRFALLPVLALGLTIVSSAVVPTDDSTSISVFESSKLDTQYEIVATEYDDALERLPANATDAEVASIFRAQALFCDDGPFTKYYPSVINTHCAANLLINLRNTEVCRQTEEWCTRKATCSSAAIITCGPKTKGVKCTTLGWAAKHIAANCAQNGRVKGRYVFEEAGVDALVSFG